MNGLVSMRVYLIWIAQSYFSSTIREVAVCCSVLCCIVLHCVALFYSVLHCCNVLQCVAVCSHHSKGRTGVHGGQRDTPLGAAVSVRAMVAV